VATIHHYSVAAENHVDSLGGFFQFLAKSNAVVSARVNPADSHGEFFQFLATSAGLGLKAVGPVQLQTCLQVGRSVFI
jgi:hypothetical protein